MVPVVDFGLPPLPSPPPLTLPAPKATATGDGLGDFVKPALRLAHPHPTDKGGALW